MQASGASAFVTHGSKSSGVRVVVAANAPPQTVAPVSASVRCCAAAPSMPPAAALLMG